MPAKAPPKKSKSARKRVRQTKKLMEKNHAIKNVLKTLSKKVELSVANKDSEGAKTALYRFISASDKAKTKGILHGNTASRKISQLTKRVNSLSLPGAA